MGSAGSAGSAGARADGCVGRIGVWGLCLCMCLHVAGLGGRVSVAWGGVGDAAWATPAPSSVCRRLHAAAPCSGCCVT